MHGTDFMHRAIAHAGPVLRALGYRLLRDADGTYVFVLAPANDPITTVNLVECISNVAPGHGTLE
jgi:hypothetical protein